MQLQSSMGPLAGSNLRPYDSGGALRVDSHALLQGIFETLD
jgi:hypothetical protein